MPGKPTTLKTESFPVTRTSRFYIMYVPFPPFSQNAGGQGATGEVAKLLVSLCHIKGDRLWTVVLMALRLCADFTRTFISTVKIFLNSMQRRPKDFTARVSSLCLQEGGPRKILKTSASNGCIWCILRLKPLSVDSF